MKIALLATCAIGSIAIAQAAVARNPDPVPGASRDECVFIDNINNWHVLDSTHVVLFAPNEKRAYLMQLAAPVSDLKFAFKVAFIDRDRNGQLCGRSPDKVIAAGSLVRQPTTIIGMTRLDAAGLQALEAQYNVKLTRKKDNKDNKDPGQPQDAASPVT